MARCGCGGTTCSCFVTGDGVTTTVTGAGTAGSPFVVSASQTPITVTDTSTIDLTLLGNDISGIVKVDPAAGNLIVVTANGLRLDCAAIATCITAQGITTVLDTTSIDSTITGAGTVANPYVISSALILAPTSLGSITATGLEITCAQVRTCFSNGPGIAPIVGGVIEASLSTDAGNTVVFGTDDGLYVPASNTTVVTGCGLVGDGSLANPLTVGTGGPVWPFACDETAGANVYCNIATGFLHVDPEKFHGHDTIVTSAGTGQLNAFGAPVGGAVTNVGSSNSVTIINPSSCRDLTVVLRVGVQHADFHSFTTGISRVELFANYSVSGSIVVPTSALGHQLWEANGIAEYDTQGATSVRTHTIPPSGSATFTLQASMTLDSYNGNTTLSNYQTQLDADWWNA